MSGVFYIYFVFSIVFSPWDSSGSSKKQRKVKCYDNVFDGPSYSELTEAIKKIENFDSFQLLKPIDRGLKHGKGVTFWWPKTQEPRNIIEATVQKIVNTYEKNKVVDASISLGAEWWANSNTYGTDIGFHYDKDEGIASTEWYMKFPLRSTLTYLTDWGAPTIILNQITNRGGNKETPYAAKKAWFIGAKENRHCHWQSNLHHGVWSHTVPMHAKNRITIAINIWDIVPKYPYSVFPTDAQFKQMDLLTPPQNQVEFSENKFRTQKTQWNKRSTDPKALGVWKEYKYETNYRIYKMKIPELIPSGKLLEMYFPKGYSQKFEKKKEL